MVFEYNDMYLVFNNEGRLFEPYEKCYLDQNGIIRTEDDRAKFNNDVSNNWNDPVLNGQWKEWSTEKAIEEAKTNNLVIHINESTYNSLKIREK